MKGGTVAGLTILAVVAGALLIPWEGAGELDGKEASRADTAGAPSKSRPVRRGVGRRVVPALQGVDGFRILLDESQGESPRFEDLEAMAQGLETDELIALLREIEFGSPKGLEGWVRCALFAEWGRRDPEAAMAHMVGFRLPAMGNLAIEQAWYSLFRGWAEVDAKAAHEGLKKLGNRARIPGGYAFRAATGAIFERLAREDAKAVWRMVHPNRGSNSTGEAVAGFFRGLSGNRDMENYLDLWSTRWMIYLEATSGIPDYTRWSPSSTRLHIPTEENTLLELATAWAGQDLDAAIAWLERTGPCEFHHRTWRASQVAGRWAREHPTAAVRLLRDERYHEHHAQMAHGALEGDPTRAVEVMQAIENPETREAVIKLSVRLEVGYRPTDSFPAPGRQVRLPDIELRYNHLIDAIGAAEFPAEQEEKLLRMHYYFHSSHVASARQALEALRNQQ